MTINRIQQGDTLELHVEGVGGWEGFDSSARYLRNSFGAVVTEQLDGICSRVWRFDINGAEVTLRHHDDIGNYFECIGPETETLRRIATDLENRLSSFGGD